MIMGLILTYGLALLLCWHIVRTGRDTFWIWIVLMAPGLGSFIYIAMFVIPDLFRGKTARNVAKAARETLDPHREYREAKQACDETPTVRNQSRLAAAAMGMGHYAEAESLYRAAAQGVHADDPVLLLGLANALLELKRAPEALEVLERLGRDEAHGRTPSAALALGRAYEATGRMPEAEEAYQWAADRMPGFEALGRHAAFKARHGRTDEARAMIADMDKRMEKLRGQFRKEAQMWRDHAVGALR
ncbi:MAG: tetratricopeptide repeat protein [Proteobacteria bacterium]|nr:tetratricopeptide repeat protein [Pseudomonadota bacterium]